VVPRPPGTVVVRIAVWVAPPLRALSSTESEATSVFARLPPLKVMK